MIAALPAIHVNATVTLELFHPAVLGAGDTEAEIERGTTTVKGTPLLITPAAVITTTLPVRAAAGTDAVILVSLQLMIEADVPPKLTP